MPKSGLKELEKYKEYVKKGLAKLTPLLQKAAVGDFTEKIEIPEKEDEFSELLVGLSLMIDDLRELEKVRERSGKEKTKDTRPPKFRVGLQSIPTHYMGQEGKR